MVKIVIDAMGGDNAPEAQVKGALAALKKDKELAVVLVGDEGKIKALLENEEYDSERIEIEPASEVITNDDIPTKAIKEKKNSSTVVAFRLLKEGKGDALVSSGSTGAVLAASVMLLGRIKGISRPALCPRIPNVKGTGVLLCDCGANLECKPVNLVHFALMASAYAEVLGVDNPRVGLLNNGTEDHKGDQVHQEANALLKNVKGINYVGNVEGRDLMYGDFGLDVAVADGYTGNVALKSIEGCGKAISVFIKRAFKKNAFAKMRAALVYDILKDIKQSTDYKKLGAALFLGVKKTVVKAHGNSTADSYEICVKQAADAVRGDLVGKIEQKLAAVDTTTLLPPVTEEK